MPGRSIRAILSSLFRDQAGASGKDILQAIIGLAVLIVGVYLAFFVLGLVLRIVVLAVVVVVVVFIFAKLAQGARKLGGD